MSDAEHFLDMRAAQSSLRKASSPAELADAAREPAPAVSNDETSPHKPGPLGRLLAPLHQRWGRMRVNLVLAFLGFTFAGVGATLGLIKRHIQPQLISMGVDAAAIAALVSQGMVALILGFATLIFVALYFGVLRPLQRYRGKVQEVHTVTTEIQRVGETEVQSLKFVLRRREDQLDVALTDNEAMREQLEAALLQKQGLSAILDGFADMAQDRVIVTDAHGTVLDLTASAADIAGWQRSQAVNEPFNKVLQLFDHYKDRPREYPLDSFLKGILETASRVPRMQEARVITSTGRETHVLLMASSVLDAKGKLHGAIVRFEPVEGSAASKGSTATTLTLPTGAAALKDSHTGLNSREAFERRLDELIRTAREQNVTHHLILVRIDGLTQVIDRYGHLVGEELIWNIGQIVHEESAGVADAYRVSGALFALLLVANDGDKVEGMAEAIRSSVEGREFASRDNVYSATVSVALIPLCPECEGRKALLGIGDETLITAKKMGGNLVLPYKTGKDTAERRQTDLDWINWLMPRLEGGQTHLISQGILPVSNTRLQPMFEVLVRVEDDDGVWITPGAYLGAVERHNQSAQVDLFILQHLLRALEESREITEQHFPASLNLSDSSLSDSSFADQVAGALTRASVPASHICFEIDETYAITHTAEVQRFISIVQPTGALFALDRCKTTLGMNVLRKLPVNYLKIHDSLTRRMLTDPVDRAHVEWINRSAHGFNLKTVATGVENEDVMKALRQIGVDYAQGIHVNKMGPLIT